MKPINPLWKLIFNTQAKWGNNVVNIIDTIKSSKYPMFVWNGSVYKTPADGEEPLAHYLFEISDL